MNRLDEGLGFMLRYENVAWYEAGKVRILDRRIYPIRTEFVTCTDYTEVAKAIGDMVTQSGGPYIAAAMGMVLAAYQVKDKSEAEVIATLEDAEYVLSHARPTTVEKMKKVTLEMMSKAREFVAEGKSGMALVDAMNEHAIIMSDIMYSGAYNTGKFLAEKVPDKGTIMTMCFAEGYIGFLLLAVREAGKDCKVICPETRPYFQGARLTASVACDMGFDVTVISDNMPAYVMNQKHVDLFTSAADVITMDGHIINKIGTFQVAMAAKYWGIPYYVTGNPHIEHKDMSTIKIEERDPELVLHALDVKTTMAGVKGYYPAFDVTPPEYVTGVATKKGIFAADELYKFFD